MGEGLRELITDLPVILLHIPHTALVSLTHCDPSGRGSTRRKVVDTKWMIYYKDPGMSHGTQEHEFTRGSGMTVTKGQAPPGLPLRLPSPLFPGLHFVLPSLLWSRPGKHGCWPLPNYPFYRPATKRNLKNPGERGTWDQVGSALSVPREGLLVTRQVPLQPWWGVRCRIAEGGAGARSPWPPQLFSPLDLC